MELQRLLAQFSDTLGEKRCPLLRAPYHFSIRPILNMKDLFFVCPTSLADYSMDEVRQASGAVFSPTKLSLLALGMEKVQKMGELPKEVTGAQKLQIAEDGTVLNLTWVHDRLLCTTNRHPDARTARWASEKSFWELLVDAVPGGEAELQESLKPGYTYSVVLLHPENSVVLPTPPQPVLVHVATRCLETMEEVDEPLPGWARKPRMVSLPQAVQMVELAETQGGPPPGRGFLLIDSEDPTSVRRHLFDLPSYKVAEGLRKNKKHLHISYLACSGEERSAFRRSFPGMAPMCDVIDTWLNVLCQEIYTAYRRVYVQKTHTIPEDHPFVPMLLHCHRKYLRTREPIGPGDCHATIQGSHWRTLDKTIRHLSAPCQN